MEEKTYSVELYSSKTGKNSVYYIDENVFTQVRIICKSRKKFREREVTLKK
jgi:hypothetical protein